MNDSLTVLLELIVDMMSERISNHEVLDLRNALHAYQNSLTPMTLPKKTEWTKTHSLLQKLCLDYGDTDWHLDTAIPDIIENHLSKHLYHDHPPHGS